MYELLKRMIFGGPADPSPTVEEFEDKLHSFLRDECMNCGSHHITVHYVTALESSVHCEACDARFLVSYGALGSVYDIEKL